MNWLEKIPAIGGLFKGGGGATTSECSVVLGLGAVIYSLPDCPGWAKAVSLAALGAVYAYSRSKTKAAISDAG